jgi:hypothetical protein
MIQSPEGIREATLCLVQIPAARNGHRWNIRSYDRVVEVRIGPEARRFVSSHGGVVYIRSPEHRCARGPRTVLDTTTDPPSDADDFASIEGLGVGVKYHGKNVDRPHVLIIQVEGYVRHHLVSRWEGCAYQR